MSDLSVDQNTDTLPDPPPDDEIVFLPGFPGYRTRPGRTGLDYIETYSEIGHMTGLFIRRFFTNTWHRPGIDPHPLVMLLVGTAILIAFNSYACLGAVVFGLVMLVAAIRKNWFDDASVDEEAEAEEDALSDETDEDAEK